jgi:hypothetical protein
MPLLPPFGCFFGFFVTGWDVLQTPHVPPSLAQCLQ